MDDMTLVTLGCSKLEYDDMIVNNTNNKRILISHVLSGVDNGAENAE